MIGQATVYLYDARHSRHFAGPELHACREFARNTPPIPALGCFDRTIPARPGRCDPRLHGAPIDLATRIAGRRDAHTDRNTNRLASTGVVLSTRSHIGRGLEVARSARVGFSKIRRRSKGLSRDRIKREHARDVRGKNDCGVSLRRSRLASGPC